jgi:hypothetical protein
LRRPFPGTGPETATEEDALAGSGEFSREELEGIEERASRLAAEVGDASLRAALQVFGEAAGNLADKMPGGEVRDPFATGD